jgi:hypothetical protein
LTKEDKIELNSEVGKMVKQKSNNKTYNKKYMKINARFMRMTHSRTAISLAIGCLGLATTVQAADPTNAPAAPPGYQWKLVPEGAPAAAPAAPAAPYGKRANMGFWKRLDLAEIEQAGTPSNPPPDTNNPAPARRIGPPPFDSPPYPDGDWQLGGGPNVIGDPGALRDSPWPFMQTIYDGPHGKYWYDNRIQLYGWWTVSGNISTSSKQTTGPYNNFPEVYDERSDRTELDQFVIYLERMADESQVDHADWGFRLAFLYGLDYRFMASRGYLNDENLLVKNRPMGYDTPMMYANIYLPKIAQGMNLMIGRIISEPDIEQQLAPNNLMASHSLVYAFDDYTTWGIFSSTKLNTNWLVQLNLLDGVDIAPWETQDPGDQLTGAVNVQYIGSGGHDSFYVGMNSFNNGTFGFNNLQECVESYTHKFNDTWWTTFEGQYMYTEHCTTAPTAKVPFEDGFYPTKQGFVQVGGVVNYTMIRIAPNAFVTVRNEWWDDPNGYRSGYGSAYYEGSLGMQYWPNKLIMIRPEVRVEHAFRHNGLTSTTADENPNPGFITTVAGPYDDGTKQTQVTFACDITYHF